MITWLRPAHMALRVRTALPAGPIRLQDRRVDLGLCRASHRSNVGPTLKLMLA